VATVSEDGVNWATPEPSSAMALPITVAPSLKSTVPVGVPLPPVTVAVNVTDCPKTAGFWEEMRPVAEAGLFTVTLALLPAPSTAEKSEAVTVCELPPVPKLKLDKVPEPAASVRLPSAAPLSSAIAAAISELLITTSAAALLITFQSASTALTRTLLGMATPEVWAVGVPALPLAVPGAAVSPGRRIWSLATGPGSTAKLELGWPVAIAGEVADVADRETVSALRSVVASVEVE
jgi:hypothetical protein